MPARVALPSILAASALLFSLQPYSLRSGLAAGSSTATPAAGSPAASAAATGTATATAAPAPSATVLATGGTATATAIPGSAPVEEQTPPRHYVVVLVIDAARPMYLNAPRLPHIDALIHNGVVYSRAYVGELESSTPGVHVTLGTGTLPRENGFLGFGWATPDTRKWVDFRTLLANGQIDPVLKSLPVPSIAARLHQFMPHAISVAASGHKDYAAVGLGGGVADYVLYGKYAGNHFMPTFLHAPPPLSPAERASLTVKSPLPVGAEDRWAFKYATMVAAHVRPRLLMMNLPETDTWGHWDGPADHKVFAGLMQNIDRGLGEIEATYRRLGILQQTDFIITADHAMMESRPARNWHTIQQKIVSWGAPIARADGSAGGVWLQNPAQARMVAEKLAATQPAHVMAIFYRSGPGNDYQYLQASSMKWLVNPQVGAALQRLADTTAGIHGPDLWVLDREDYTFDSNNVSGKWKGTHGGATWKVQHIPLILSGPGILKGVRSQYPARSIDIAPTVERLLGLPYIKRDGVILADAFSAPLPGERGPEKALAGPLGAEVTALQAQSQADERVGAWPSTAPVYRCSVKGKPNPLCSNSASTSTNQ